LQTRSVQIRLSFQEDAGTLVLGVKSPLRSTFTKPIRGNTLAAILPILTWAKEAFCSRKGEATMFSRLLPVLVFSLAINPLLAQESTSPDAEPSNRVLLERIQQLEKRLSELEEREHKQAAAMAASSASAVASNVEPAQASATGPATQA